MNYNNQLPPELLEIDRRRKRKTRIVVIVVVAAIILFFSAFVFAIFSIVGSSDAYKAAKAAITKDEKIKSITGGIEDISMTNGHIETSNGYGSATFNVVVEGREKEVDAYIELEKQPSGEWQVVELITE